MLTAIQKKNVLSYKGISNIEKILKNELDKVMK